MRSLVLTDPQRIDVLESFGDFEPARFEVDKVRRMPFSFALVLSLPLSPFHRRSILSLCIPPSFCRLFFCPCRPLSFSSPSLYKPTNQPTLTRLDDEIYAHTQSTFPELFVPPYDKLIKLDEEWMKSPQGKERWRVFIES